MPQRVTYIQPPGNGSSSDEACRQRVHIIISAYYNIDPLVPETQNFVPHGLRTAAAAGVTLLPGSFLLQGWLAR